jgi:hypothetical protein
LHVTAKETTKNRGRSPDASEILFEDYTQQKVVTARFPDQVAMLVEDACADVETSCSWCEKLMEKAESELIIPLHDHQGIVAKAREP